MVISRIKLPTKQTTVCLLCVSYIINKYIYKYITRYRSKLGAALLLRDSGFGMSRVSEALQIINNQVCIHIYLLMYCPSDVASLFKANSLDCNAIKSR